LPGGQLNARLAAFALLAGSFLLAGYLREAAAAMTF